MVYDNIGVDCLDYSQMNDNFENLLYQSGLTAQGCWDQLDEYALEGIERLARLVIEDCIRIIHEQERIPEQFFYPKSANQHELAIKNYFGFNE